ncbi:hypothetical protein AOL_s00170g97 [Orbilia oligospora ATCC 24927]|uniref:Dienelactone hydrolase domain-containing protein n=1 Tax=Arthrobotrys oligospora (strain ATCC 24927 / CBS 115.81 / DSM 1491) TaxID=756982 RepID=G1XND1_ARTOA|nr:hypothetical protein AOL_s00170g97 [Orbilia oligospora ATCC 24927]EGX45390.1 hypothetical protein AOL_s00170g97 [Orbilia oligospora ATCC 24927]
MDLINFEDVTGPATSKSVIVFIYGAYGYSGQILFAADTLSELSGTLVIVPDILGEAAIPPKYQSLDEVTEEEKNRLLTKFMDKINNFHDFPGQILEGMERWRTSWPLIEKWGIFGLCFGGKVAALMSRNGTPYVVSGQAHPSFIANEDPELISIPHICLASKDEDPENITQYKMMLDERGYVNTYPDSIHGWMGTKADLEDSEKNLSFNRGYHEVSDFFRRYL